MRVRLQDSDDPANRQEVACRGKSAGLKHTGKFHHPSSGLLLLKVFDSLQEVQMAKRFSHNSPHGLKVAAQRAESRRRPDTRTVRPEAARDRLSE